MNNFEAESIRKASVYLQEQLKMVKSGTSTFEKPQKNAYILEDKKETMFQRFVGSIFHK